MTHRLSLIALCFNAVSSIPVYLSTVMLLVSIVVLTSLAAKMAHLVARLDEWRDRIDTGPNLRLTADDFPLKLVQGLTPNI